MSKAPSISRINPTDNQHFANSSVSIVAAAPSSRINLRATSKGAASFSKSFGLQLPEKPGAVVSKAGKSAFWIGPDEWLIVDEKAAIEDLMPKGAATEVSAVDISHRNVAYALTGPGAANVLNAGCPRDLSLAAFPVGTASRTIFGKAEVVIYRSRKETFRLECWRSFAPYVWALLTEGARDAHI